MSIVQPLAGALALLGPGFAATAAITLDLDDATSYARTGITATRSGNTSFIVNNELIGIYGFQQTGLGTVNPFWSTCLSPQGQIDWSQHTYQKLTFAQANPGLSPSAWAYSGSDYWGIQNANYLWRSFSSSILGSVTDQQARGAALALAMYEVLYDSTGYGNQHGGATFSVTSFGSSTVQSYYNTYLASLSGFNVNTDIYVGYVLKGDPLVDGQNGQEFILIGAPVPEPTTVLAGALLLLPFAASTLRFLRKKQVS